MFGWNILFMNPIRKGGQEWRQRWFIKSRGTESTSADFFNVILFLGSYLLTATWKDICREDLLAPSTRLLRTVLDVRRKQRLYDYWECVVVVYFRHLRFTSITPCEQIYNQTKANGRHQHHNTLLIILCSNLLQHRRIPYFQAASSSTPTSKRQTVGLRELCDLTQE